MSRNHHRLKTETQFFQAVERGEKKFEIRKNDRDFRQFDMVILDEVVEGAPTGRSLGPSHLISRDHCKKFGCIPLIWDIRNIQLHCRECHHHWENGTKKGKDFERNMEYISYLFTSNVIPKELYIKYLNRWAK